MAKATFPTEYTLPDIKSTLTRLSDWAGDAGNTVPYRPEKALNEDLEAIALTSEAPI